MLQPYNPLPALYQVLHPPVCRLHLLRCPCQGWALLGSLLPCAAVSRLHQATTTSARDSFNLQQRSAASAGLLHHCTAAKLQTVSKVFIPLRYSESLYGSEGCWAKLLPQLIMVEIAETSKQKPKIYPQSNQNSMVRTLHQRLIRYPGMMSPLEPGLHMALQGYI